jgi:hypothetical protein
MCSGLIYGLIVITRWSAYFVPFKAVCFRQRSEFFQTFLYHLDVTILEFNKISPFEKL